MYIPSYTKLEDLNIILELVKNYSFGILITKNNGSLTATHLPFLAELNNGKIQLTSHMSLANDQWKNIEGEALIIFSGPHHYITPSWYDTNKAVPTWNYAAVHIYGNVELVSSIEDNAKILARTVDEFEFTAKYSINDVPEEYYSKLLKGIKAFTIISSRIEAKWKLSQNHSQERRENIIRGLTELNNENASAIAELMKRS